MEIDRDKGYQTCGLGSCDFTSEVFTVLEDLKEVMEVSVLLLGAGVGGGVGGQRSSRESSQSAAWHINVSLRVRAMLEQEEREKGDGLGKVVQCR